MSDRFPSSTIARSLSLLALVAAGAPAFADEYVPPPAASVNGYWAELMPCKITRDGRSMVECKGGLLEHKTLRELSILRNTVYARYGWDGYRKPWLKAYIHSQPWFKPNPKFTYKLLSDADRKNAHFIAVREQSFTSDDLTEMKNELLARRGKTWNDKPQWEVAGGKLVNACKQPKGAVADDPKEGYVDGSLDCRFGATAWYRPDPSFTESKLTADDKIELGLLSRAMGEFSLDNDTREKSENSLDRILKPEELRQLSLRDLRLLRNTIYARRGRAFKSKILQEHFEGMSWYKVNSAYNDKLLSSNDTRNIGLIKSVENEFGGPLSDEDWLTEPATDGA